MVPILLEPSTIIIWSSSFAGLFCSLFYDFTARLGAIVALLVVKQLTKGHNKLPELMCVVVLYIGVSVRSS